MGDVIQLKTRNQNVPGPETVRSMPITEAGPDTEHDCTRQARILNAWLLDSIDAAGIDWTIDRLKQALQWAEMRKLFRQT